MKDTIYISRRCDYCQQLLIMIHKHDCLRGLFQINDIDTSPFPKMIQHVPTLLVNGNQILPGDELFKLLSHIIREKEGVQKVDENRLQREQQMKQNSQVQKIQQEPPKSKEEETMNNMCCLSSEGDDDFSGYCFGGGGSCSIGFSSIDEKQDLDMSLYSSLDLSEGMNTQANTSGIQNKPPKSEIDQKYEKMLQERGSM
jgi:hypothetical protein